MARLSLEAGLIYLSPYPLPALCVDLSRLKINLRFSVLPAVAARSFSLLLSTSATSGSCCLHVSIFTITSRFPRLLRYPLKPPLRVLGASPAGVTTMASEHDPS